MWLNLLLATGVLIIIAGLWFGVTYLLTPRIASPDGESSLTGECGDTMEIHLKFSNNRIVKTSEWTNGCTYSTNCLYAAANLAKGKTPEEALDISAHAIQESIGGLPKSHMHCATLAQATLREAVDDYMIKTTGRPSKRRHVPRFRISAKVSKQKPR